jgi:hypothetical protein
MIHTTPLHTLTYLPHHTCPAGCLPFPDAASAADWHSYTLVWDSTFIATYLDSQLLLHAENTSWWSGTAPATSTSAPFDQPFHLLLNLAVGGSWPGEGQPEVSELPCRMLVDHVRVYDVACGPGVVWPRPARPASGAGQ